MAQGQVTVETLGGGRLAPGGPDSGFVDGDILAKSQFNTPAAIAGDSFGNFWIADRGNDAVRLVLIAEDRVTTALTGLPSPAGVAVDAEDTVYIVTEGDGILRSYDRFGVLRVVRAGLLQPRAVAINESGILVGEGAGRVRLVDPATGSISTIVDGLASVGGLATLSSGLIAVSEEGGHRVRFVNPANGVTTMVIGTGGAGFRDGLPGMAQFRNPRHLSADANGGVIVADLNNHRVRQIAPDGIVTTVYGVDPATWEGPACLTCDPVILPGWLDGSAHFAEAKLPSGVALTSGGDLYTTELGYHLVRRATGLGSGGSGGGGGGSSTNVVAGPPIISPSSGFYPMGATITVTDTNRSQSLPRRVFYTIDGSEPTTNSLEVALSNGVGTIQWASADTDLRGLRLRSFVGTTGSEAISGTAVLVSELGIHSDLAAGVGSTLVVPIVLNVQAGQELDSIAFVVEVEPNSAGMPVIPDQLRALPINQTNDFFQVAGPSDNPEGSSFIATRRRVGDAQRLAIAYVGSVSNFAVDDFAVAGLIAVPVPAGAVSGQSYRIEIIEASATTVTGAGLNLNRMPARTVTLQNIPYVVGDSAPAVWYNAGDFGNGNLRVNDANNAFNASLGLRVPYGFSDLFDAMDAFPPDGDGAIRFLDWQLTLERALRLEPDNWARMWTDAGTRVTVSTNLNNAPNLPAEEIIDDSVWWRDASLSARPLTRVRPGEEVRVPMILQVARGKSVAGLQFRAVIEGNPTLNLTTPARFMSAPGVPNLSAPPVGLPFNEVAGAWSLGAFEPALQGEAQLGWIAFTIPQNALDGQIFNIRFLYPDGAPADWQVYEFETISAAVHVGSNAPDVQASVISDEWRAHYFSEDAAEGAPERDIDGDGLTNEQEFLAGTSPRDAASRLALLSPARMTSGGVGLRWHAARGRLYRLEWSPTLDGPWELLSERLGRAEMEEVIDPRAAERGYFYRLRLVP